MNIEFLVVACLFFVSLSLACIANFYNSRRLDRLEKELEVLANSVDILDAAVQRLIDEKVPRGTK